MNHLQLFHRTCADCSSLITRRYSTSFSLGIRLFHRRFRAPICGIYGFVRFADEIVTVEVPQRKGDPLLFDTDEGVRPGTTAESLGGLRPSFDRAGTVTAGNASQISDGASAVIVMSKERAKSLNVTALGEVVSYGMVAGPDTSLLHQPARAILKALA